MKKICNQCQTEMIENCRVSVEGGMYGIKVIQKGKGVFNNVSAKPKAAVCPNCGYVAFYINEFRKFNKG
ncbi:nucleic acid-binding protein [Sporosarcina sp. BI001-red]|uniref:nucleic acid-binding protein n=1 Tax=Sporosarcina sp. BI001-red TaxID=2282866 RepID=UPI000E225300|nr:nucleic acid-binding protein [Sporosarcina sp. BI001-red]REB05588.1 nucleic acid-binding protein [Sporosarcina sp. BI001-red]